MPFGMLSHKPPAPPPAASCYICFESSIDDNQPLLRNCACRGDAGWAHVACLAKFAASKVTEAQKDPSFINAAEHGIGNGRGLCAAAIWGSCILCKTPHMQNMALAMAKAFVKQYEHLPDTNALRFDSLYYLATSRFDVGDPDGALELYDRLRQMCDVLTSTGVDVRGQTAQMYSMIGFVFLEKQQFEDAVLAFEQERELLVAKYGPNSPTLQKNSEVLKTFGIVGCGHKKSDTVAELAKARKNFRENQKCVVIRDKLVIHSKLVTALSDDGRHHEAMEQLEKLLAESRQSFGPNHPNTLHYENDAIFYRKKRDTAAALVKAREKFRENQECADITERLYSRMGLVRALIEDGRHQEAMEQLEKLLAESRQSLGPNHPETLLFENNANVYRQRMLQFNKPMASNSLAAGATASEKKDVWAVIDCEQQPAINGQRVQVLRATKDARKYVCLIKNDKGVSTKFKAAPNQFILETETTVVVHGLVSSTDLNGIIGRICSFDKEKRRYAVSVEIKKTSVSIKPINLNIVFT